MVSGRGVHARSESRRTGVTISFGERFAASDQFDSIFREGMALVERTAAYLDGPGRKEAKGLPGPAAMLYANESMRLTKRLLQLASWLMIRRDNKEGKIGADVTLLAQTEVAAVTLVGGGTSSAMAHKSNPVAAELLVALARFNAGLAGTLQQAMVHEYERSGAAWTLEWLTLPQIFATTGASLRHAATLLDQISLN